ncbi:MAG: GNAT family N-acetyltransferase [Candidatus Obscuribacter sp.]|nr:GNAT family N-acetyltransferase [Candidatus Obscuribacter sp.]
MPSLPPETMCKQESPSGGHDGELIRPGFLSFLSFPEVLKILKETHRIWSGGLTYYSYLDYLQRQASSAWGRRNLRMRALQLAVPTKAETVSIGSSCKTYNLTLRARNQAGKACHLNFVGLGAIYTPEAYRGRGYARVLLKLLEEEATAQGKDGLLLFSDIGSDFYSSCGFQEMSAATFTLELRPTGSVDACDYQVVSLSDYPSGALQRHYSRWLARERLAVERSEDYFNYKIMKESYLHRHSKLSWPELLVLTAPEMNGYAILELGGATVRVLEIIAQEPEPFFKAILHFAMSRKARRIRGWESVLAALAPGFDLRRYLLSSVEKNRKILTDFYFEERTWGCPMILPLKPGLEAEFSEWSNFSPCPILELDHL